MADTIWKLSYDHMAYHIGPGTNYLVRGRHLTLVAHVPLYLKSVNALVMHTVYRWTELPDL